MTEHPKAVRVLVYQDSSAEYRWRAVAANGEPVADSGEGYRHHTDAVAAATSLFPDAELEDYSV